MNEMLKEHFAVVWHGSGRVDFERLADVLAKNVRDFQIEVRPTRVILAIAETEVLAGDVAKEFRAKLKEQKKERSVSTADGH